MLREKRGDDYFFGMRDWYVKPEVMQQLDIPREKLVLSVKYAGYDQPLVNYPLWGKEMLDEGYGVVLDMHVYDAEYPHPVYWYDNKIVNRIFDNVRAGRFTGIVYQDYTLRGEDSADNPVRRLTQLTVAGAMNNKPWSDADAEKYLTKTYRKAAPHVLQSLKAVAHAQEQFIKLMPAWFWRGRRTFGRRSATAAVLADVRQPRSAGRHGFRPAGGGRRPGILRGMAHRRPLGRSAHGEISCPKSG